MGWFSSSSDKAMDNYRAARRDLERLGRREKSRGVRHETAEFRRANARVIKAEKAVPWWKR